MATQARIISAKPNRKVPIMGLVGALPFLDRLLALPTPGLSAGGFGASVA